MKHIGLTLTEAQANHILASLDRDVIGRNTLRRRGLISMLSKEIKQQTERPGRAEGVERGDPLTLEAALLAHAREAEARHADALAAREATIATLNESLRRAAEALAAAASPAPQPVDLAALRADLLARADAAGEPGTSFLAAGPAPQPEAPWEAEVDEAAFHGPDPAPQPAAALISDEDECPCCLTHSCAGFRAYVARTLRPSTPPEPVSVPYTLPAAVGEAAERLRAARMSKRLTCTTSYIRAEAERVLIGAVDALLSALDAAKGGRS